MAGLKIINASLYIVSIFFTFIFFGLGTLFLDQEISVSNKIELITFCLFCLTSVLNLFALFKNEKVCLFLVCIIFFLSFLNFFYQDDVKTTIYLCLNALIVSFFLMSFRSNTFYFASRMLVEFATFFLLLCALEYLLTPLFVFEMPYSLEKIIHVEFSAVVFLLLNFVGNWLLIKRYRNKIKAEVSVYSYIVFYFGVSVFFSIWFFQNEKERNGILNATLETKSQINLQGKRQFTFQLLALERIVKRWQELGNVKESFWRRDVSAYITDYGIFDSISYVDKDFKGVWIEPKDTNIDFSKIIGELNVAKYNGINYVSSTFHIKDDNQYVFYVILPIFLENEFEGALVAVYNAKEFIDSLLNRQILEHYSVRVYDNKIALYEKGKKDESLEVFGLVDAEFFYFGDIYWNIDLVPSEKLKNIYITNLPSVILVTGLVISLLLGLVINFIRALNELKNRNESILDNVSSGVLGLDAESRTIFANNKAIEMTGFSSKQFLGARQHNLIHHHKPDGSFYSPTDCPIYHSIRDGVTINVKDEVFWKKDGTSFPVEYTVTPQKNTFGKVTGAVVVFMDVTKNKEYEDSLKQAKKEAERANQVKSLFLSNVSHEIRTPLNAIIGSAEIALEILDEHHEIKKEEFREKQSNIIDNSEYLLSLINDILDFSKIEACKLTIEKIEFSVPDFVKSISSMFHELHRNEKVHLVVSLGESVPEVLIGDVLRVKQEAINLLSNAIKFTKDRGFVKFSILYEDRFLVLKVSDTGTGIPEDKVDTVFEAFMQSDDSISRKYRGTGLGLAISRNLCKLMGGDLICKSAVGVGSSFIATFKLDVGIYFEDKQQKKENKIKSLAGVRVLIAEDWIDNQKVIKWHMDKLQANYKIVENGEDAVIEGLKRNYDIILMDINMPKMNGCEALIELRNQGFEGVIIALTANAMHEQVKGYLQLGFNDVISKPFRAKKLLEVISHYI